ncbi:MAG TPA: DUF2470 domain-containing protein [Bauldia sp.]|nr:DUF2470 domain-containing protein [Bauldia sp.]
MNQDAFNPGRAAKRVLRIAATGTLATLRNGAPFASLVTVATTPSGEPILLLSKLAVHTKNLDADARAALLLVAPGGEGGDPLAGARLTLTGAVTGPDADPMLRRRFLARHPEAAGYAGFADFSFRRVVPEAAHLVAGFGRIVELAPAEFLTDLAGRGGVVAAEEDTVTRLNADRRDAIRLCATRLLGEPDGDWTVTGADPEGIDLRAGERRARLAFPEPVTSPEGLRQVLAELARKARSRGTAATI